MEEQRRGRRRRRRRRGREREDIFSYSSELYNLGFVLSLILVHLLRYETSLGPAHQLGLGATPDVDLIASIEQKHVGQIERSR